MNDGVVPLKGTVLLHNVRGLFPKTK